MPQSEYETQVSQNEAVRSRSRKQAKHNNQRWETEVLGTPVIRRKSDKQRAYLQGLEQFQFDRAMQHLEENNGSDVDLKYVLNRVATYLSILSPGEFSERLAHIEGGNYTNADVIKVSTHYFLEGNVVSGQVIRRLLSEERTPNVGSSSQDNFSSMR